MDIFKATVLYGEFAGSSALEKQGGTKGKNTLIREARNDYVRAYERADYKPEQAKENFSKVASKPDDRFGMMKQLANLYYDDGKDREAASPSTLLIREKPLIARDAGLPGEDRRLRAARGNKKRTVAQVRRLVKIIGTSRSPGNVKTDEDKKSPRPAKDWSERTLSNLAVNWHNEAEDPRRGDLRVRQRGLRRLPGALPGQPQVVRPAVLLGASSSTTTSSKYDKAASSTRWWSSRTARRASTGKQAGKPGKWLPNAAYNAVLA